MKGKGLEMSMKNLNDEPIIMYVRVTDQCNSGCFMCKYARGNGTFQIEMLKYDKLLDTMRKIGSFKMIRFTGGEPLLVTNLPLMIKKAKEQGFLTSIITNGYLIPNNYKTLIDCGLDQIVFSLDGSSAEVHDKLRNFPNCFNNIISSIKLIKEYNKYLNIRVNTVASKYNIADLCNLYDLLIKNGVDSWSIIPIRTSTDGWNDGFEEKYIKCYKDFIEYVEKNKSSLKFLGYSLEWGGRNNEEIHNLFYKNKFYGPIGKCKAVNLIRFYIPNQNEFVPCNCASHRIGQMEINIDNIKDLNDRTKIMKCWLEENGPTKCKACEPLNAYISDNYKNIINMFEI